MMKTTQADQLVRRPRRQNGRVRGVQNTFNERTLIEIADAYETPAASLAFAILRTTITDLQARCPRVRYNARAFVRSDGFARLAASLDLDVSQVRARCERIAAAHPI